MQQTEGLANLFIITRDDRYRKLAAEIAAVIERRPGDHVHGYLSSLRGVMDLYHATAEARFLEQCEVAWQEVAQSGDLLITGGVPEGWSPNGYLAIAERAVFNELAFNQFATGDFGHRLYSETELPAYGSVRAWWCCTLHGLRCFPDIHSSAFRRQDAGLCFDLPVDSKMETATLSAIAESSLAEDGTVRITIVSATKTSVSLRIRKPEWAETLGIRLNGRVGEFPQENGYVRIEPPWVAGDVVQVEYGMQLKSQPGGKNRVFFTYGPWLLGAAASDNPAYFNELTTDNRLVQGNAEVLPSSKQAVRQFGVPIAATVVQYVPAEFPDQPATVALRAIAEQTGQTTTAWELRFLTQKNG
jgi:DUF1680 family protein